jgi:hypothetical protein
MSLIEAAGLGRPSYTESMRAMLLVTSAVLAIIVIGVGIDAGVQRALPGPVLIGLPQGTIGGDYGPHLRSEMDVPFTVEWTKHATITVLRIEPIPLPGYLTPELACIQCAARGAPPVIGHTFVRSNGSTFEFMPMWRMRNRPGSTEALAGIRVSYEYDDEVFSLPIIGGAWLCWSTRSYDCTSPFAT